MQGSAINPKLDPLHQRKKQVDLRIKKNRDLGLRSGMVVKIGVEDGSVVDGTVMKRTTKKCGKFPNKYDVKLNANSELVRDVNFDVVDWHMGDKDDVVEENVCQVTEDVFATLIEKDRHGEERVIEAKRKELKVLRVMEEVWTSEVPDEDRNKIITTKWNFV